MRCELTSQTIRSTCGHATDAADDDWS